MGNWIEIFRGGRQVDSEGKVHDGDRLIDLAVTKFNAAEFQPPLVIGHPEDDAPAYGWVEELRKVLKDGLAVLEARFGQVQPEFREWVRKGLYKTRSSAFYDDGRLRHVGFLGAAPPAVKGLRPAEFKEGEAVYIEFSDTKGGITMMDFKEFFDNLKTFLGFAQAAGLQSTSPVTPDKPAEGGGKFTEADLETAKAAAAKAATEKVAAEFAEQQNKAKVEARKAELGAKVDDLVKTGIVQPSAAEPLKNALFKADVGDKIEFAEGKSGTPADWLLEQVGAGKSGLFSEIATKGAAGNKIEFAEAKAEAELGRRLANRGQAPEGGK